MNRFRNKKKGKDDGEESSSGFFRRNKKQVEEPKVEINLDTALPSNDDFRTSLLMTNLSARFSMLREQDDPNTKIGKASDDSVLFPKRQSRLMDYSFGAGLHDIAEVESIKAAPSFSRMDSYVSDGDSMQGNSIMDRSRPNEGNNLFGGRQKIYKIAAGTPSGGMNGRALYEDDVAQSAFQRWRQAERERRSFEEKEVGEAEGEADPRRSESPPPMGYNRRRETSSTTSSASAVARNSTAATSITSQVTPSVKDWQSASTAANSAVSTPAVERSVTRTRRLYEQGLNQDLHEQQSSALSRIDTLSRQRLGSRTPDFGGSSSPSPTTTGFIDRFSGERRPILTKASAPNLRSISPPASGSSVGPMDLGLRVSSQGDAKSSFGSPPLSPPISETSENPLLASSLQPGDRGKATALGVFQKPSQPYDESRYAQRQLQLQQGRETPTQRFRTESNASFATDRSRSSSSMRRQPYENKTEAVKPEPPVEEEAQESEDDSDDEIPFGLPGGGSRRTIPSSANLERPSDNDHPALRQLTLPPLDIGLTLEEEPVSVEATPNEKPSEDSPADSPTLGPAPGAGLGAGLSGMVRQHLRSESNASSIYGLPSANLEHQYARDSHYPTDSYDANLADTLGSKANPWTAEERDWARSYYGVEPSLENLRALSEKDDAAAESKASNRSSNDIEDEADEFANQLADARRRVREKLTSYVESDSSRSGSPTPQAEPVPGIPPSNSLGISILKPKSSRGSLIDRSRSIVASQTKAMKMLGLGSATMSTSPAPSKQSFDEKEITGPIQEEEKEETQAPVEPAPTHIDHELEVKPEDDHADENVHPGLRAFRQARRELQRRKELETLARHQTAQTSLTGPEAAAAPQKEEVPSHSTPRAERPFGQRTPSRERRPPPSFPQRIPSDESRYGRPGPGRPSGERDRSGSETSGPRSRSNSRAPRMRNNSSAYEHQPVQLGPTSPGPRQPMLRSPGLPGTDIRRSPIMPPQGYPGSAGPSPLPSPHPDGQYMSKNLKVGVHPGRPGYDSASGQPSPISPIHGSLGLPPSPYAMGSNSGAASPVPRPSAPQSPSINPTKSSLDESMKRTVKKKDISEPTFVMSTSRVPTVTLPEAKANPDHNGLDDARNRSRSQSNSSQGRHAPPLPPINPRRKQDGSRARAAIDAINNGPQTSLNPATGEIDETNRFSAFSIVDDEDIANHRKRLRKVTVDPLRNANGRARENIVTGPPASRAMMANNLAHRGPGAPEGMI